MSWKIRVQLQNIEYYSYFCIKKVVQDLTWCLYFFPFLGANLKKSVKYVEGGGGGCRKYDQRQVVQKSAYVWKRKDVYKNIGKYGNEWAWVY